MRRAVFMTASTVAGLVVLLTLKANTAPSAARVTPPAALAAPSPPPSVPTEASAGPTPEGSARTTGAHSTGAVTKQSTAAIAVKTGTGKLSSNQYGSIQVRVTVAGTRITKVTILQLTTSGGRSAEIDSYAVPQLQQETLAAGNAQIDAISGASYTSASYTESLQSALDQIGY